MPTFGSTSAAITLSFDFHIIYISEHIINNSFFSFQYVCVNVCNSMEIWIAAYLSHSGWVSECCCPSHMSLATPVCPMGTLSCSCGVRWAPCVLIIELPQQYHQAEQSQTSHEMDHNQPMDHSWEPPDPGDVTSLSWDSMPKYILKKEETLRNIYYSNCLCKTILTP